MIHYQDIKYSLTHQAATMTFTIEPSSPLKGMQLYEKIDLTKGPKITIKWKETVDGPEHHIPNVPKNMIIKFSPHASRMWAAVFDRKDPKNHELNLGVRTDIDVNALKYLLNQMLRACQTQGLYYLQLYPTQYVHSPCPRATRPVD